MGLSIMPAANAWNALALTGKLIVSAIVVIVVVVLIWWFFIHPGQVRQQRAIEKANGAYSGAQGASGKDAVETLSTQQASEAERAKTTQEANNAIRNTSGATVKVAPDTNAAGLRALCMHNNYRDTPRCRKLLGSPTP